LSRFKIQRFKDSRFKDWTLESSTSCPLTSPFKIQDSRFKIQGSTSCPLTSPFSILCFLYSDNTRPRRGPVIAPLLRRSGASWSRAAVHESGLNIKTFKTSPEHSPTPGLHPIRVRVRVRAFPYSGPAFPFVRKSSWIMSFDGLDSLRSYLSVDEILQLGLGLGLGLVILSLCG